jgi:hypothetical protein
MWVAFVLQVWEMAGMLARLEERAAASESRAGTDAGACVRACM